MPRFFFNYRERDSYSVDDVGVDFDSFEMAYIDAFDAARAMWSDMMKRRVDPRRSSFEILDGEGNLLAILNFNEVLESCTRNDPVPPHKAQEAFLRGHGDYASREALAGGHPPGNRSWTRPASGLSGS